MSKILDEWFEELGIEPIDGNFELKRKGIRCKIWMSINGKRRKQPILADYPEGESYETLKAKATPQEPRKKYPRPVKETVIATLPVRPEKTRALSVRQPWAELIISGQKATEYRSQNTNIRDRVYIYSSSTRYSKDDTLDIADQTGLTYDEIKSLPRGCVIGSVEIVDCIDGESGYEWILKNPIRFTAPRKPDKGQRANPVWFNPFGK